MRAVPLSPCPRHRSWCHRLPLLAAVALGMASCHPEAISPPAPANVVLISVDTLSRGALRAFEPDAPHLPNLDRFAGRALVFRDAFSTAGWTLPAHGSLLTGLYPDRHGATHQVQRIHPEVVTLAEQIRRSGFETVAFTDATFLDPQFGFADGFERYDGLAALPGWRPMLVLPRGGQPEAQPLRGSALFDRGLAFLEQRAPVDRPFFLFLQTYTAHDYFDLHPWAVSALPPQTFKEPTSYLECLVGNLHCTPEDWHLLEALYRAELFNLDNAFGRLLEVLDRRGLTGSTLVFFVSDHGEGFAPGLGRIHHGGRLHADLVRVPFLVAGPGVVPGATEQPASLVDVMPTALEMLGLQVPPGLDGASLAPLLRGDRRPWPRTLYAMDHYMWWEGGRRLLAEVPRQDAIAVAVIKRGLWYIRGESGEELYDMAADPQGVLNLAVESAFTSQLRHLAAQRGRLAEGVQRAPDSSLQQELRSLGYVR